MWIKYNTQLINLDNVFDIYIINNPDSYFIKINGIDDGRYTTLPGIPKEKLQLVFDYITSYLLQGYHVCDVNGILENDIERYK